MRSCLAISRVFHIYLLPPTSLFICFPNWFNYKQSTEIHVEWMTSILIPFYLSCSVFGVQVFCFKQKSRFVFYFLRCLLFNRVLGIWRQKKNVLIFRFERILSLGHWIFSIWNLKKMYLFTRWQLTGFLSWLFFSFGYFKFIINQNDISITKTA